MSRSFLALEKPPKAAAKHHSIVQHGQKRNDPFFWLRNEEDPEVIRYLEAENAYAAAVLKPWRDLEDRLYHEMRGRIQERDVSVPVKIDHYFYYSRTEENAQYAIHCRKKESLEADEEVILDENELAQGHEYFQIGVFDLSPDHRLLAYSVDTSGEESYTLLIKDLETGQLRPGSIENCSDSFAWANDNQTYFYDQLDAAMRPHQVMRRSLGSEDAALVYEEKDSRFFLSLSKSRSQKYIFISADSKTSSEIRFLQADHPGHAPQLIRAREEDLEYSVDHSGERFLFLHNEQAKNFKISEAPIANPGKENWSDFIPYDPKIKIDDLHAFCDFVAILAKRDGLSRIKIIDLTSRREHEIEFTEPAYAVELDLNPEFDTRLLRFDYSSLVTPHSVIDYDVISQAREIKKQMPVLGGFDQSAYQSEQIFATADDGARIPISLLYRKGFQKNGTAPLFLTGYGAYGADNEADFGLTRLSLVDRGFVFAIAHIRGGEELGREWYEQGKLLNKKNSFTDFIRCTEHLISNRYCRPDQVAIWGGSAGGLLVGAAMNMRPDLFTCVVAAVPFVDVLNTMSDSTLPLTVAEYEEWGNPKDRAHFEYISDYSPYENLREQPYPHLLVTAGLHDPRVSFWEAAKWVARQRTLEQPERLLLLKTNMRAGHGGDSGRFDSLKEVATEYAFILAALQSGIGGHAGIETSSR